jgi:hypothetical protein
MYKSTQILTTSSINQTSYQFERVISSYNMLETIPGLTKMIKEIRLKNLASNPGLVKDFLLSQKMLIRIVLILFNIALSFSTLPGQGP